MALLFPGQQKNEQVYLITRPHLAVLFKRVLALLFFAALFLGIDAVLGPAFPAPLVNLIKSVYLMFLAAAVFSVWVLYYLNYQIVTNERIVDVTQKSLLWHTTAELHLGRIQDVTTEVSGLLGNLFNFGKVYVLTASESERFEFDDVPNPHNIQKLILDLYEKLPPEEKVKINE